jgi:transposase-like protein
MEERIMGKGRKWSPEEKVSIVLEGVRGTSVKDVCAKHRLSETQYYRWRDQALEGMKQGFADKREREQRHTPEADNERLLKIIGEQAAALDLQKKLSKMWLGE